MADEELKKKKKIRGGYKGYVTITLEKVQALLDDFELSVANEVKTYRIAITEKLNILSALDDEILTLITEEQSEDEIRETGIFRESIHEMIVRIDETLWERSIQPKFPEISVQNSMDRLGPTGKVSKIKNGSTF